MKASWKGSKRNIKMDGRRTLAGKEMCEHLKELINEKKARPRGGIADRTGIDGRSA